MISLMRKNKLLFILSIFSLLLFTIGFISYFYFDSSIQEMSFQNINQFLSQIKSDNYSFFKFFMSIFFRDSIFVIFIWIFGISIFGVLFSLSFYFFEIFLFSLEVASLFSCFQKIPIVFSIFFIFINLFKFFLFFILVYYSSSFSILLFRFLFFQKDYSIKIIFKKYLKVFIIVFIFIVFVILLEALFFSKVLIHFI